MGPRPHLGQPLAPAVQGPEDKPGSAGFFPLQGLLFQSLLKLSGHLPQAAGHGRSPPDGHSEAGQTGSWSPGSRIAHTSC